MGLRYPGIFSSSFAGAPMAAPTLHDFVYFVGSTSAASHSMPLITGTPTPGALSYTTDDIGIVVSASDASNSPTLVDTGWTLIADDTWDTGHLKKWWKRLTSGGLPDPFVVNRSVDGRSILAMLIVRSAHLTAPIGQTPFGTAASGSIANCPDLTTAGPNRLILRLYAQRFGNHTDDTGYPSATTGLFLQGTNGSIANHATLGIAWETVAGASVAVGAKAFAPTGGSPDANGAETIEVIPP